MRNFCVTLSVSVLIFASCKDNGSKTNKPIVLGDSATIVTETDSQYLQDFVGDINIARPVAVTPEPVKDTIVRDTSANVTERVAPARAPDGLVINFKELTVNIPAIKTKMTKQQDPGKANGVNYELADGDLNATELVVSGGNVQKVSMRYQSTVVVKNGNMQLRLPSLNTTTSWKPMKGNKNTFEIEGLEQQNLEYVKASPAAVANAVKKAARVKRLSRSTEQKMLASVKRARSVKQKPLNVVLSSVMWKIEGKDAAGKYYVKQIRIDIPL
jgi:hypothetical protein